MRRLLVALCAGVIATGLVWAAAAMASLGKPFVPTGVLLVGASVAFGTLMGASAIGIVLVSLLDPMIWLGAIIMVALAGMIGIGAAPVVLMFAGPVAGVGVGVIVGRIVFRQRTPAGDSAQHDRPRPVGTQEVKR